MSVAKSSGLGRRPGAKSKTKAGMPLWVKSVKRPPVWMLLTALAVGAPSAQAKPGDMVCMLENPTPVAKDQFSVAIAAVGNNILVGASNDDTEGYQTGAAYLFDGSGALLQTFLNPAAARDSFGNGVAAFGNDVLIGASTADIGAGNSGAVYLFDGSMGSLIRTFQMPVPVWDGFFGYSIAAMGQNVVVGCAHTRDVYMFEASTGILLRTFVNPNPSFRDGFGWSIATVGDNVLAGAWGDDTQGGDCGMAYLFDGATGGLIRTIHNPTPVAGDNFGYSVAAVGDNVLISARQDDTGASNTGAAYLFDGSTGDLLHTFLNPAPEGNELFGCSVAAVGGNVLIGAFLDNEGTSDAGAAYLFDGSTGELLHTFLNPTPAHQDMFGYTVASMGDNILIGCLYDDAGGTDAGAVYLYEGIPEPATLSLLACGTAALLGRRRRVRA